MAALTASVKMRQLNYLLLGKPAEFFFRETGFDQNFPGVFT